MSWQTWAPFQSPEVRNICAHMTTEERAQTVSRGAAYGIWCALTAAIPTAFLFVSLTFHGSVPMWLYILAGSMIVVHLILIPVWRRAQMRFLRNTQWARGQGTSGPATA
jgi:hypothetical protein